MLFPMVFQWFGMNIEMGHCEIRCYEVLAHLQGLIYSQVDQEYYSGRAGSVKTL